MKNVMPMVLVSVSACAANTDPTPVHIVEQNVDVNDLIESNFVRWKTNNISHYSFTYRSIPTDCPEVDAYPSRVITVKNTKVTQVFVPDFGKNVDIRQSPTINDIFESMQALSRMNLLTFSSGPKNLSEPPVFDGQYGYPLSYYADATGQNCDGKLVSITNFSLH